MAAGRVGDDMADLARRIDDDRDALACATHRGDCCVIGIGEWDKLTPLKEALAADADYARGWHDNLACCAMDEGVGWEMAQAIAARFMRLAFDVDTSRRMILDLVALAREPPCPA